MRPIWPGTTSLPVQSDGTFFDRSLILPAWIGVQDNKQTNPIISFKYLLKLVVELIQCSDDTLRADRYEERPLFNSIVQGDKVVLSGSTLAISGMLLLVFCRVIKIPV